MNGVPARNQLAKLLLKKSYREGDFTLSSGKKSDYYFDCRVTALSPYGSYLIGLLFYESIQHDDRINGIAGLTMGADPIISSTVFASQMFANIPSARSAVYGLLIRKESKGHGTKQYVEGLGNASPGDGILVVEDVVTTGSSLLKACERIEDAGLKVVRTMTILDREEGGREAIEAKGYEFSSIFTRAELVTAGSYHSW